jgi:hypothetical protein
MITKIVLPANDLLKVLLTSLTLILGITSIHARDGILKAEDVSVSFFSETPVENIEAHNSRGQAVLDTKDGSLFFVITIKDFQFEKSLMQKHFNKNYLESDKYPEATFKGKIIGWNGIPSAKTEYRVEGELNMHGITRKIELSAELGPSGEELMGQSTFTVLLKDYDIRVPKIVVKKIAEEIEIRINANFTRAE